MNSQTSGYKFEDVYPLNIASALPFVLACPFGQQ